MKFISFIYKIPQRFIIFPFVGLLFLALVYGMLWLFIEHRINNFLNGQKNNFQNYIPSKIQKHSRQTVFYGKLKT